VSRACPLIGEIDDYLKIRGLGQVLHTVMMNEGWGDALLPTQQLPHADIVNLALALGLSIGLLYRLLICSR